MKKENATKELYRQLRTLSCEQLWTEEMPAFDRASAGERLERVALIRAVGVVFSESGTEEQKQAVRPWLRRLLQDPAEKIRRYAMAALPKIGGEAADEAELLALLRATSAGREQKFLGRTLDKIGGPATLAALESGIGGLPLQTQQKVKASVARAESPSAVRMENRLKDFTGLRIHLHARAGLESIVRDEAEAYVKAHGGLRIAEVARGLVALTVTAPFSLGQLYALRCFGTIGFLLGSVKGDDTDALAKVITSARSRRLLETFTEGAIRYRLEFIAKGHQRGAVRLVANRAYELCSDILNDARNAPWTVSVYPDGLVELSPRITPDPRFIYRQRDVPAASHPPLAACMARLAGPGENEVVWDPFCGSGLELIERAKLGGVRALFGTDRSAEAVAISQMNFAAAGIPNVKATFACADFRDFGKVNGATLIVTNPPMGKRVPIPDLRALIRDLFAVAARTLRPGGRLVFANPLRIESPQPSLKLESRQAIDMGGFDARLEKYVKQPR